MIIIFALLHITPNFHSLYTYYSMDYLLFTKKDLADLSSFSSFTFICGIICYYCFFIKTKPQNLFRVTTLLNWLSTLSFFFVVTGIIQKFNFNVKLFCLFSFGFQSFLKELNTMPIYAIWCDICPKNLEGVSITLITGISNISAIISECLGSLIIYLIGFRNKNYDDIWKTVLVDSLYVFVLLIVLFIIKFPEVQVLNNNEKYFILQD